MPKYTERFIFHLDATLKNELMQMAADERTTAAPLIRRAIMQMLIRHRAAKRRYIPPELIFPDEDILSGNYNAP